MKKPVCSEEGIYDYTECIDYIEWVYDIETRNYEDYELFKIFREEKQMPRLIDPYVFFRTYTERIKHHEEREGYFTAKRIQRVLFYEWKNEKKKSNPAYCNFWHWIIKEYDVTNGGMISFRLQYHLADKDTPQWVLTILHFMYVEFPEKTLKLCTEW